MDANDLKEAICAVFWLSIAIRTSTAVLLAYPSNRNATFGEEVILPCKTDLDLPVYWYFNNHEIFYGGKVSMFFQDKFKVPNNGPGVYDLFIKSADESYNGEYECGDDEGQGEKRSAHLYVTGQNPTTVAENPTGLGTVPVVVGVVVGFVLLTTVIAVGVFCYRKRNKRTIGEHGNTGVPCKTGYVRGRVVDIEENQRNQTAGQMGPNRLTQKNKASKKKSAASEVPKEQKRPLLLQSQKGIDSYKTPIYIESSTSPKHAGGDQAMDSTPADLSSHVDKEQNTPHRTPFTVSETTGGNRSMDSTAADSTSVGTRENVPYRPPVTMSKPTGGNRVMDATPADSTPVSTGQNMTRTTPFTVSGTTAWSRSIDSTAADSTSLGTNQNVLSRPPVTMSKPTGGNCARDATLADSTPVSTGQNTTHTAPFTVSETTDGNRAMDATADDLTPAGTEQNVPNRTPSTEEQRVEDKDLRMKPPPLPPKPKFS